MRILYRKLTESKLDIIGKIYGQGTNSRTA